MKRTISTSIRLLIVVAGVLTLGMPATAQAPIETTDRISVDYGEAVTFQVETVSTTPLTAARLTVQIDETQSIYTDTIALSGDEVTVATIGMPVADLPTPPFARLTYFWQFQDENGQLFESDRRTTLYRDTAVDWVPTAGERITLHGPGSNPDLDRAALGIAETALANAESRLGASVTAPIDVFVYPQQDQLIAALALHGAQAEDWVAAYSITGQHIVLAALTPGPEVITRLRLEISHELAHVVLDEASGSLAGSLPGWFNEGIALTNSPEPDPVLRSTLNEALRSGALPPIERLCNPSFTGLPQDEAALAYAQSESLVRYIEGRYGQSALRDLMVAYADGASCNGGIERALGNGLETLEQQWLASVQRGIVSTAEAENAILPWLVVLAGGTALAALFIWPQQPRIRRIDRADSFMDEQAATPRNNG